MYATCQPCAALASHVEKLWWCDGHPGVNGKDRALPDGRFQLAFSLAEGPISALADPMGDGGGIAPSLLIGIRSRFSIIDTAKLRSAMGVVFRPGGVHAFLNMPADAFHDKNVSLDLIWGSMVQPLRDRLRSANDRAKKFQILEVALLSRITERVQLNTAVRYALVEFVRRPQIPMVRELAHEASLSRRRFAQLFRAQIGLTPKLYFRVQRFQNAVKQIAWLFRGLGTARPCRGLLRSGTLGSRIPGILRSLTWCISGKCPSLRESRFHRLTNPG